MRLRSASLLLLLLAAGCSSPTMPPPVVTRDATLADADDATNPPPDAPVGNDVPVASDAPVPPPDVPDASMDAAPDVAPDAAPDVTPDAAPDAAPDVTTDATPDAAPDVAMDALTDAAGDGGWVPIPGGACNARERNVPTQESPHVDPDAGPVVYLTNPPASGPHFGDWARWGARPNIPRGNWVHNLEHGGVALLYRCPAGTCDATRDALVSAANGIPADPACMPDSGEPRVRVVITSDNVIETPVAGAAWGWLYAADCVDAASIRSFYMRHAGMAPENFCIEGSYPP